MLKAERQQLVYSICAENGSTSVKDISEQLDQQRNGKCS